MFYEYTLLKFGETNVVHITINEEKFVAIETVVDKFVT